MSVATPLAAATPNLPHATRLPGGAVLTPVCAGAGWIALRLDGEIDVHDRYAVIDALAGLVLDGARRIHVDARGVTFIDVAALRAFDRVRRFLARDGGTLTIDGLPRTGDHVWRLLGDRRSATIPTAGAKLPG